jgi:hypothetical protein
MDANRTAFLTNVPESWDDPTLMALFSSCGRILRLRRLTDPQGRRKGSVFVEFEASESLRRARDVLEGAPLMGPGRPMLQVKIEETVWRALSVSTAPGAVAGALEEFRRQLVGKRLLRGDLSEWIEDRARTRPQKAPEPRGAARGEAPILQRRAPSYEDVVEGMASGASNGLKTSNETKSRRPSSGTAYHQRERRWEAKESDFFSQVLRRDRERDAERAERQRQAAEALFASEAAEEFPGWRSSGSLEGAPGLAFDEDWQRKRAKAQMQETREAELFLQKLAPLDKHHEGPAGAGLETKRPAPGPLVPSGLIPAEEDIPSLAELIRRFPTLTPAEQIARFQEVEQRKLQVLVNRIPVERSGLARAMEGFDWPRLLGRHEETCRLLARKIKEHWAPLSVPPSLVDFLLGALGDGEGGAARSLEGLTERVQATPEYLALSRGPGDAEWLLVKLFRWAALCEGAQAHQLNIQSYLK